MEVDGKDITRGLRDRKYGVARTLLGNIGIGMQKRLVRLAQLWYRSNIQNSLA